MRVILASSSPYRQAQLKQIGLPFSVEKPQVDEEPMQKEKLPPSEIAGRLAALKGQTVADLFPQALVIAGDQVAHFEGSILTKAGDATQACAQLARLSGRKHALSTAIWVRHPEKGIKTHLDETEIEFFPLSESEIRSYVEHDKPFDCVGAYKIERRGLALVKSIRSEDQSAIVGIPLIALCRILREWGLPLPFNWQP